VSLIKVYTLSENFLYIKNKLFNIFGGDVLKQLKRYAFAGIGPIAILLISAACWGIGSAEEYLVVGSEGFSPGSNVDYFNTYGCGGAYIVSGSGALVAPLHLPQGATVTEFKVFFCDSSSYDMTVYLDRQNLESCGYSSMAQVTSSGSSGYSSQLDNTIAHPTIDNEHYSYHVYAYCSAWDSNLKIKGALITYEPAPVAPSTPDPWVVADGMGRLHYFVIGTDHALWDNMGGNWYYLGGVITSNPVATVRPDDNNHIVIAVKGNDAALWMFDLDTTSMTGNWVGLGGIICSATFITSEIQDLSTSLKGSDGALWENRFASWNPQSSQWVSHGGQITDSSMVENETSTIVENQFSAEMVERDGRMVSRE
jgi:hypothetical protein